MNFDHSLTSTGFGAVRAAAFAVVLAVLCLTATDGRAAGNGWFVGTGALADAAGRGAPDSPDALGYTRAARLDYEHSGWQLFGGYRLSRKWAFEAAYRDMGETGLGRLPDPADFAVDVRRVHPLSTRSMTLAGTGVLPLTNSLSLFGKVGMFGWNGDSSGLADAAQTGMGGDGGTGITYGLGGKYDLGDRFSLSAGWERLSIQRDSTDFFSAGFRYRFE